MLFMRSYCDFVGGDVIPILLFEMRNNMSDIYSCFVIAYHVEHY